MKKEHIYKILYAISALLAVLFLIFVALDAVAYQTTFTSAPFYIFVIVRALEFLLPALLTLVLAFIFMKKIKK